MVRTFEGVLGSGTQSLQRATAMLRIVMEANRQGLRMVDIAAAAELGRPTAHRILQGLVGEGLLSQDSRSRRYVLGPFAYEMGLAASVRFEIRDACLPHVQHIADLTGDTVFLLIRSGLDGICVDRREGAFPVKAFVLDVGRRRPLGVGASGSALLAALPEREAARILATNAPRYARLRPPRPADEIARAVAAARREGFSQHDLREAPGVRAVGMAIVDDAGFVAGAISVSALSARLRGNRLAKTVAVMRDAVAAMVRDLGKEPR